MDNRKSIRIAEITAEAVKVFGSSDMAKRWMGQMNFVLGKTPISMLESEHGAVEVRKILASIASGGGV